MTEGYEETNQLNDEISEAIAEEPQCQEREEQLDEQEQDGNEEQAELSPLEQQPEEEELQDDAEGESQSQDEEYQTEEQEQDDGEELGDLAELEDLAESEEESELAQPQEQADEVDVTVELVVEAVLFASDEPLTVARLANIVGVETRQVRQHIDTLNEKYQANEHAFRIEQIAGGFQMLTLSPFNTWLKKLLRARNDSKLSPAALETLAIIAYKQPIIRADIEAIRGVAVGEMIRGLMFKGLVKIVGRAEVLGRPMLYGTTKKFLEIFGLNTLKDLPKIEELKKPNA